MFPHGTLARAAIVASCALAFAAAAVGLSCGTILGADPDDSNPDAPANVDGQRADGQGSDADAGADGAMGCVADLAIDSANCGACGHTCGGAACVASLCVRSAIPLGANEQPIGPNARVVTLGTRGAFTDDVGGITAGLPGYISQFDPTAAAPKAAVAPAAQNHPALVALPNGDVFWTLADTASNPNVFLVGKNTTLDVQADAGSGGAFLALATSPSGASVAASVSTPEIRIYDSALALTHTYASGPAVTSAAIDLAFDGEDAVVTTGPVGVIRCELATGCATAITVGHPVVAVAMFNGTVFFATDANDLQSAPLSGASRSTLLMGLVKPRQVLADANGAYVLDEKGIHTMFRGAPLLLASGPTTIFSFAISTDWVYYLNSAGLFRVHR